MTKENEQQLIFDCFFDNLRHNAEEYGLGWKRQTAELIVDLDPNDLLSTLSPEELYYGKESTLYEILWHLTDNCGDHAVKEGELLRISIQGKREGNALFVEVCDNGPGVPRLGERRVGALSIARHGNSNLALATKAAWGLGGDIVFENIIDNQEEIQGAKFTIMLPIPKKA